MNTKAFTLIELLVVVLIIGILTAVAVPQYQKAVEKSRAVQAIAVLKGIYQGYTSYFLQNGQAPTSFSQLDTDLTWNDHYDYQSGQQRKATAFSNADWSLTLYDAKYSNNSFLNGICIVRIKGKYAGGGFCMWQNIPTTGAESVLNVGQLYCIERRQASVITLQEDRGAYCAKLFGGTNKSNGNFESFALP